MQVLYSLVYMLQDADPKIDCAFTKTVMLQKVLVFVVVLQINER